MTTQDDKDAALAALADLATLLPGITQAVQAFANGGSQVRYLHCFQKTDGSGNQIPPSEIKARLEAIAGTLPLAQTIVSEAEAA